MTAPKKMAGKVRIQTFVQLIKFGGYRLLQNRQLLVAVNKYAINNCWFVIQKTKFLYDFE